MPGYPAKEDAPIRESDYEGRQVRQIEFDDAGLHLGQFRAVDFFGDGSFYLLDSPGVRLLATASVLSLARAFARSTLTTLGLL